MKTRSILLIVLASLAFVFSGCASNGYVNVKKLTRNDQVKGVRILKSWVPAVNTHGYKEYADFNNAGYRCSIRLHLYTIAKEALKQGYPYFTLRFPEGSNKTPYAVASTEKLFHYCVPGYYDKDTDLLDDKCGHIGFGNGTPGGPVWTEGIFFKKRSPLVPVWDAKKIINELEPSLVHECWNDDREGFEKTIREVRDFGSMDMD
jgi:hypothetical protein